MWLIEKICALVMPLILFMSKYLLPYLSSKAHNSKCKNIRVEIIHFPVDMLFIAIAYITPKIAQDISAVQLTPSSFKAFVLFGLMLYLIPYYVLATDILETAFNEKKRIIHWMLLVYIGAVVLIILTFFVE